MIRILLFNLLLTLPLLAAAQATIPKVGSECPSGYRNGKGAYCYSSSSRTSQAIEKIDRKCPSGYRDGKGAYCYNSKPSQDVITKVGGKCPSGYRDGKGAYCYGK
jgi:uncharacterized Fe-S cluster protein YjdI